MGVSTAAVTAAAVYLLLTWRTKRSSTNKTLYPSSLLFLPQLVRSVSQTIIILIHLRKVILSGWPTGWLAGRPAVWLACNKPLMAFE